ncbi:MAG: HD domain-containing protein [Lachnospiraceae bacterium]|nr:HD domain-containing protein [Lachnospiraceae bacterium]
MLNHKAEDLLFRALVSELAADAKTNRMKKFIQHSNKTTYDHCMDVARHSYYLARRLHLQVDEKALVRGAFLHDYYLYDWHDYGDHLHGYHHPDRAVANARRDFDLTPKEIGIIRSHMWPLTLTKVPSSKEAVVVCIIDKVCSLRETLDRKSL